MRVLIGCEYSAIVRESFAALGHDAVSVDLLPSEGGEPHIIGDIRDVLADNPLQWDLFIAFPPCTALAGSGSGHFWRKTHETLEGTALFRACLHAPIRRVCVENPIGLTSRYFGSPDQIVHPWMWGGTARKRTGLWLNGLPPLRVDVVEEPDGTTCPVHSMGEQVDRGLKRSRFDDRIAWAMATQWGG